MPARPAAVPTTRTPARPRVAHLVSEFSAHEAIGRTIAETVARVPGEHHLLTAHVVDSAGRFASVTETGVGIGAFGVADRAELAGALTGLAPDVVHVHGGALSPLLAGRAARAGAPGARLVQSVYAWPTLPSITAMRRVPWAALRSSNVLRARVAVTTVLGGRPVAAALRRSATAAVLTPDPSVAARLAPHGVPVSLLPSGAAPDGRRARFDAEAPVVLFAGRAEAVRGIDSLLAAFALVLRRHPAARLRLLLLPTPELTGIERRIAAAGLGDAVEVRTDPVADLTAELAAATVGAWPFLFDYTTSPPAMAVAEAMATGLPVVATDVACVQAVAAPGATRLVAPGDAAALATAIGGLLDDRRSWQRAADAGVEAIRAHHNWSLAGSVTAGAYGLEAPATPAPRPLASTATTPARLPIQGAAA